MMGSTAPAGPATGGPPTRAVLDFRPSRHGLRFPNRFPPNLANRLLGPGSGVMGLCGGMAFIVRDLFERGIDPPPDATPPAPGSRRYRSLVHRQLESFDWLRLPFRFWALAALHPDPPTWWARLLGRRPRGEVVRADEWPRIRDEIDAGRLAQVGLLREPSANPLLLTRNHQVLAYAYRAEPDRVAIRIYDPNWPGADGVELVMEPQGERGARFAQSTGEALWGFFLAPYAPAEPRAWRIPS